MKVNIGPHKRWIGPYQIAEKILFWKDKGDDKVHAFGAWLAEDSRGNDSYLSKLCLWIDGKKKRRVKIRIDRYDTWNLDHTLALIIVPCLKQLRESKPGSPFVDDEDVPDNLKAVNAPKLTQDEIDSGHPDEHWHLRWQYVMGEMIWAFEQVLDEDRDIKLSSDKEYLARFENGVRLFGKYYLSLWD
jgi:hypothetical protein